MASVDSNLDQLLTDLQQQSDTNADYLTGGGQQRVWMIPTNLPAFDPFDVAGMGAAFDRTGVNAGYAAEYSGAPSGTNTVNTVMGMNMQIAYMAMMERAFRERHKTPSRAWCHLAARKRAHGDAANSVHIAAVKTHIEDVLNA